MKWCIGCDRKSGFFSTEPTGQIASRTDNETSILWRGPVVLAYLRTVIVSSPVHIRNEHLLTIITRLSTCVVFRIYTLWRKTRSEVQNIMWATKLNVVRVVVGTTACGRRLRQRTRNDFTSQGYPTFFRDILSTDAIPPMTMKSVVVSL